MSRRPPVVEPSRWLDRLRGFAAMLALGFRADPRLFAFLFTVEIVGGLSWLASTYGTKLLTDCAVQGSAGAVLAAAALIALTGIVGSLCGLAYVSSTIKVEEKGALLLDRRLMALTGGIVGLEHHERPDYIDELDVLRRDRLLLGQMPNAAVLNLRVFLQLVGGSVLLARIHPLLIVLPLFGFASFYAGKKAHEIEERVREANTERSRLIGHVFNRATSAAAGKELRVFGLGDELLARHRRLTEEHFRHADRADWQGTALNLAGSAVFAAGYVGSIALVLFRALQGQATAGDVVLAIALTGQMNGNVANAVNFGTYLLRAMRATGRYLWLLDYQAATRQREASALGQDGGPAEPARVPERLEHGITLADVTFRYPGTSNAVLDGLSLHLPAGAVVALVGENGAGKTTLVKLLARYYDPDAGRMLVDGIDLRRLEPEQWRARLSAAFQDFRQFEFLVRETVGIGALAHIGDGAAVMRALARAGADDLVPALPKGLETQLGKEWPGGIDLSGGQWQRLALGRAFMRTAPLLVVFDEPTAAIDAPTEHALFERIAAAARGGESQGTVTVIVSHRFSTVRMADLIVVLDKGHVVEQGSHDELVRRNGLYAELYGLQAAAYR